MQASTTVLADGFRVNSSGNELTISWGVEGKRKALAVVLAILCLLLFLLFGGDSATFVLWGLLLLASAYWLIAMFSNRTILRLTEEEWVIWHGPVPLPTRDFIQHKRRIDPSRFVKVDAEKDPRKEYSWGRLDDLGDIFFELVFWLVHQAVRGSQGTYTLYAKTRDGVPTKLLGGLREEQASSLEQRLENLLPSDVRTMEELGVDRDRDGIERERPTSEPLVQGQAADTPDVKTTASPGPGNVEDPLPWPVCPECGGANPSASAFCGECGTALIASGA